MIMWLHLFLLLPLFVINTVIFSPIDVFLTMSFVANMYPFDIGSTNLPVFQPSSECYRFVG